MRSAVTCCAFQPERRHKKTSRKAVMKAVVHLARSAMEKKASITRVWSPFRGKDARFRGKRTRFPPPPPSSGEMPFAHVAHLLFTVDFGSAPAAVTLWKVAVIRVIAAYSVCGWVGGRAVNKVLRMRRVRRAGCLKEQRLRRDERAPICTSDTCRFEKSPREECGDTRQRRANDARCQGI